MGTRMEKLAMALSAKTSMDGLWVGASCGDDAELLRMLCESIKLIKTHDPIRYKRLLKDLKSIWICLLPGSYGAFKPETDSCQINARFAASHEPIFIASVIVHEATHARLRRFGYAEDVRYRLEAACRRQEIAFARKVPDSQAVIDWLQARFPRADQDYSYEGWARRHNEGLVAAAYEVGIPSWLVKTALKIRGLLEGFAKLKRGVSGAREPN